MEGYNDLLEQLANQVTVLLLLIQILVLFVAVWFSRNVSRADYVVRAQELKARWQAFTESPSVKNRAEPEVVDSMNEILDWNVKLARVVTVTFAFSVAIQYRRERKKVDIGPRSKSDIVRTEIENIKQDMVYSLHRFLISQSFLYAAYSIGHWMRVKRSVTRKAYQLRYPRWPYDVRQEVFESGCGRMQTS